MLLKSCLNKSILSAAGLSVILSAGGAAMAQEAQDRTTSLSPPQDEVVASLVPRPEIQTENGISYVSGGVGDLSQQAMKQLARDFNLRLSFAVKQGDYLADIPVSIKDRRGNTVLETVSPEPLFYAHLKPGRYTVTASANGVTRTRQVNIGARSPAVVHFAW